MSPSKFKIMLILINIWWAFQLFAFGIWSIASIEESYILAGLLGCCALVSLVALALCLRETVKYYQAEEPKYTWQFTPDNCFDCCAPFRERDDGHLSFYMVVIDCRITHCCPECFPWYQDRWMG